MAAITNQSSPNAQPATDHSPSSPNQSHRATRAASSPWAQILRGESELIAAVSSAVTERPAASMSSPLEEEGTENLTSANGSAAKRQAWNKPSNEAADVEPVMGAHSWPPLSESGKVSSRSSSDSLKSSSDGSPSSSLYVSQGQVSDNDAHPNSTPNHALTARQRSMKRNGATPSTNGPPAQSALVEATQSNRNPSSRDHAQRSGFHGSNDHPQQRNSFRNRGGGGGPNRGDGSHHPNYGGRRNQEWNGHRNFNGRDTHIQPQRAVPGFMRHPHPQPPPPPPPPMPPMSMPPFISAPPMRPFVSPITYSEMGPVFYFPPPTLESLRGVPLVTPMSPIYTQPPELQLHARIVSQIDYYFSNENLIKDVFLRQNMDNQGWVAINLIAGFKKVLQLTDNVQLILDALRNSTVVEVQGEKVRKRDDWMRWIMPPSVKFPNVLSPKSQEKSSQDVVAKGVQNISLDEKITNLSNLARVSTNRLLPEDTITPSQLSSSEGTAQYCSVQSEI